MAEKKTSAAAHIAVSEIIDDLFERGRLGDVWRSLDDDTVEDIGTAWEQIIQRAIDADVIE